MFQAYCTAEENVGSVNTLKNESRASSEWLLQEEISTRAGQIQGYPFLEEGISEP